MIRDVLRDMRYAVRSFARRPLFTGVILLTLALGIGSTVAIFSVANAVLFRALPFKDPDRLAFVWTRLAATDVARSLVSGPDFKDYQTETTQFQEFAGAIAIPGTLTGDGPPERITNAYVTYNLLSLLGVQPVLGRTHIAEDAFPIDPKQFGQPDPKLPPGKVVLSYGLWQRRFGGDRSVIGAPSSWMAGARRWSACCRRISASISPRTPPCRPTSTPGGFCRAISATSSGKPRGSR